MVEPCSTDNFYEYMLFLKFRIITYANGMKTCHFNFLIIMRSTSYVLQISYSKHFIILNPPFKCFIYISLKVIEHVFYLFYFIR